MARPLRIAFPGALYHVTARGNNRQRIFVDDLDRQSFLSHVALVVERYGWIVHGYCQLGNHYHLVVETPRANISAGMRHLNGRYAMAFNERWDRKGHLFQARYHAELVQRDAHMLELIRYLALNPVRTTPPLCERPEDWRWSSYPAAIGSVEAPGWLSIGWTLGQFADELWTARSRLKAFVDGAGLGSEARRIGIYVGSDAFAREQSRKAGPTPIPEVPRPHWDPAPPSLDQIFATAADPIGAAHREHGYTLREIAEHLGCHYSAVSRRLQRSDAAAQAARSG